MVTNPRREAARAEAEARRRALIAEWGEEERARGTAGDTFGIEERCRGEWARSPELREEFSCLEAYTAFRRAEAKGLVRIISRKA